MMGILQDHQVGLDVIRDSLIAFGLMFLFFFSPVPLTSLQATNGTIAVSFLHVLNIGKLPADVK